MTVPAFNRSLPARLVHVVGLTAMLAVTSLMLLNPAVGRSRSNGVSIVAAKVHTASISRVGYKCPRRHRLKRILRSEYACVRRGRWKAPKCVNGYVRSGSKWRCVRRSSGGGGGSEQSGSNTGSGSLTADEIQKVLLDDARSFTRSSAEGAVGMKFGMDDASSVYDWGTRDTECWMVSADVAKCLGYLWVERWIRDGNFRWYVQREIHTFEGFSTYVSTSGKTVYVVRRNNIHDALFYTPQWILCSNAQQGYASCS